MGYIVYSGSSLYLYPCLEHPIDQAIVLCRLGKPTQDTRLQIEIVRQML